MDPVKAMLDSAAGRTTRTAEELLSLAYTELRRLAAAQMARERPGQTLNPTALVHEAYMRLIGPGNAEGFSDRNHFFAAAAEAMRRILIDRARAKGTQKRGGDRGKRPLCDVASEAPDDELLALNEALDQLAVQHSRKAKLVELRYFAGLTMEQSAEVLGTSLATANRDWAYARAWLFRQLAADFAP